MSEAGNSAQIWGLTGGIASGKSTAGIYFAEAGIPVVDADLIARELSQEGGAAYLAILKRFGFKKFESNERTQLRELVFKDAQARLDLEALLHPLIIEESNARMQKFQDLSAKLVVYEATLLVETGRYKDFDGLIVIDASPEIRKLRIETHRNISPALAQSILNSQASDDSRKQVATVVIENAESLDSLKQKVRQFLVDRHFISA